MMIYIYINHIGVLNRMLRFLNDIQYDIKWLFMFPKQQYIIDIEMVDVYNNYKFQRKFVCIHLTKS